MCLNLAIVAGQELRQQVTFASKLATAPNLEWKPFALRPGPPGAQDVSIYKSLSDARLETHDLSSLCSLREP